MEKELNFVGYISRMNREKVLAAPLKAKDYCNLYHTCINDRLPDDDGYVIMMPDGTRTWMYKDYFERWFERSDKVMKVVHTFARYPQIVMAWQVLLHRSNMSDELCFDVRDKPGRGMIVSADEFKQNYFPAESDIDRLNLLVTELNSEENYIKHKIPNAGPYNKALLMACIETMELLKLLMEERKNVAGGKKPENMDDASIAITSQITAINYLKETFSLIFENNIDFGKGMEE